MNLVHGSINWDFFVHIQPKAEPNTLTDGTLYLYILVTFFHTLKNITSFFCIILTDAKSIVPAEINKDEVSPYWSFNETADISKYEDFDHKKFLGKYKNINI